jgi:putative transposase
MGTLKESERSLPAPEILRTYGISQGTFYKWRAKYGGLKVFELKSRKILNSNYRDVKQ